ncbi:MAG: adenylyl-sulfate kinase [Candidatus Staskawiczbacteria bacterium]|nr:adenylyl-sulfate kinase [Candidatus Staskawiczbacteria bacterium]
MYKIFWLTGLPCAGKTTIAKELAKNIHAEILDGDDIRKIIKNTDFSFEGRRTHMNSVAEFASILSKYNHVVVALVSPLKEVREEIKERYSNLTEIYVYADIDTCKKRDVKGMYKLAMEGKIKNFTGVDDIYEEPGTRTTVVDTTKMNPQECVKKILDKHYVSQKYSLFIGRWQPLHQGHMALFDKMRQEGRKILVGIRNTGIDEQNPYSVGERVEMIKKQVPDAEVVILPDIEAVCYGRKVGYEIKEIKLGEDLEKISATAIRAQVQKN